MQISLFSIITIPDVEVNTYSILLPNFYINFVFYTPKGNRFLVLLLFWLKYITKIDQKQAKTIFRYFSSRKIQNWTTEL